MRCISLLPEGLDSAVQRFRECHDPLAHKIPPHITVVFPFKSPITDKALIDHAALALALGTFRSSSGRLGTVKRASHGYVYFTIDKGDNIIRQMCLNLHSGPLMNASLRPDYEPHITIARVSDKDQPHVLSSAKRLNSKLTFSVREALIERIGSDDRSIEITRLRLGSSGH